jgi:hypothetical protein
LLDSLAFAWLRLKCCDMTAFALEGETGLWPKFWMGALPL